MSFEYYSAEIFERRPTLKAIDIYYYGESNKRIYYGLNRNDYKSIIHLIQNFYRDLERLVLFNEYNHLKKVNSNIMVKVEKLDCSRLVHRKYTLWIDVFCRPNIKIKSIAKGIYPFEFQVIYPK